MQGLVYLHRIVPGDPRGASPLGPCRPGLCRLPRPDHRAVIEGGAADRIGGGQRQLVPQLLAGDDGLVEQLDPFLDLGLDPMGEGISASSVRAPMVHLKTDQIRST
jgi:hypothetical protein